MGVTTDSSWAALRFHAPRDQAEKVDNNEGDHDEFSDGQGNLLIMEGVLGVVEAFFILDAIRASSSGVAKYGSEAAELLGPGPANRPFAPSARRHAHASWRAGRAGTRSPLSGPLFHPFRQGVQRQLHGASPSRSRYLLRGCAARRGTVRQDLCRSRLKHSSRPIAARS